MNLDIEGTKHEKVVIIVLAYVMGFTAGFICFGIGNSFKHNENPDTPIVAAVARPAHVAPADTLSAAEPAATEETAAVAAPNTNDLTTTVTYTDGKLQVHVGEATYLLSIKSSSLDSTEKSQFMNQGTHIAIPAYSVSPDNMFVYFCEQQTGDDTCNSFMFDVTKNVIKYVSFDGKKLTTNGEAAKAATWSDKGFTIDGKTSKDATDPAVLGAS